MTANDIKLLLSSNLRRLRTRRGYSQLALAVKAGLTQAFINDIENGKKWISPETMARLAEALNVEAYQFLLHEENEDPKESQLLNSYINDITQSILLSVEETNSRYRKQ